MKLRNPREVKKPLEVKKPTEAKKPVEVKKPTSVIKPVVIEEPEPVEEHIEAEKISEEPFESTDVLFDSKPQLNELINVFSSALINDFQKREFRDIEPFLELLELEPENLASLKEQLGEFLNQLKSLLDKTSQFSNFYPLFYDVEYIRKGTRSNRLDALLNYDLDMEDKLALQKFLSQFGMDDSTPLNASKFGQMFPMKKKKIGFHCIPN